MEKVSVPHAFYPYHYAPRASDFYDIDKFEFHFSIGKPFKPFDQLMGVLPAASAHALPLFYRKLMTDALSPILDFYPADFQVDINGKRFAWQGICKLPFIEESRLLAEIAKVEHTLTDEERRRNSFGRDVLFVHISHPLGEGINSFCKKVNGDTKLLEGEVIGKIDPKFSDGMNGFICLSDKSVWPVEIHSPIEGMKMIAKNGVLSVFYHNPPFHSHIPRPLPGVILFEEGLRNMRGGSEKRKLIGGAFVANKIGAPREQNKRGCGPSEQNKGDGNKAGATGLQGTITEVNANVFEGTKAEVNADGLQGKRTEVNANGVQGIKAEVNVDGLQGLRTEVTASGVQDVKTEGVEKFESIAPSEQNKGDGNQAGSTGLQGTITEGCTNVFQGTKDGLQGKKTEANEDGLQGIRTEVNASGVQDVKTEGIKPEVNADRLLGIRAEVNANGLQDVKSEVVSRKRKRKSKKMKPVNRTKGNGNQGGGADGLQGTITEGNCKWVSGELNLKVNANGLQGVEIEVEGIKTEAKSSKRKPRAKKRKQNKIDSALTNIFDKLES
ncbi:hypothetical protein Pint_21439 [Pistacia integerrima]|uniref:Uncharacterized protein n=1 Tax=Pistacia integerrima TaxID=434235 RepID=A0ACC0XC48_9ROSI|nr:hypothetical protein Pint_21439 [Pistacia integerrima]